MFKKRIRLVRASIFFLSFLLLCGGFTSRSSASDPFLISFGPLFHPIHEDILWSAFNSAYYRGAMTGSLIDGITGGNRHVDLYHSDFPDFHFAVAFPDGWQSCALIGWWKEQAGAWLMEGRYDDAKAVVGHFTHLVADFFAHSNWVEHHKSSTIEGLEFDPGIDISSKWPWLKSLGNGWVTEVDDYGDAPWFWEAYYAAVYMTDKVFVDWVNSLYDTYNSDEVNWRLSDWGYKPLWIIMDDSAYKKLGNSCTIHWQYGLLDAYSQVRISLLKDGAWLGDIAEVPLMNFQHEWQVGTYYDNQGWHWVNPYDGAYYNIQITYLNKPQIKYTVGNFRIVDLVFTNPIANDIWYTGEHRDITWWSSIFLSGTDAVLGLYKGGSWYGEIAYLDENALNSGYYNWHLSVEPGDDYQISIKLSSMDFPILSNSFSLRSWQ